MPRFAFTAGVLVVALFASAGCGPSVQGGLANAPAMSRFARADAQSSHDPIANGAESCSRGAPSATPLRGRLPPCPRVEASAAQAAAQLALDWSGVTQIAHTPWIPAAAPMGACFGMTAEPWQLPSTSDEVRSMCAQPCAPSLLRCGAGGWRRQP